MNRRAPGEPVAFFHGGIFAGLDAKGYSDTWHTYTFWRRMILSNDPKEVAALFREDGIHYVIAPTTTPTNFAVAQKFLDEWTASAGVAIGLFELRKVLPAPLPKLRSTLPAPPGTYDDLDDRIEFTGSWLHDSQFRAASGGSITYSDVAGDTIRFFFTGSAITYVYTMALNRGTAEVAIDGKPRGRINQYSAEIQWQGHTDFQNLIPGPHTIEIRVLKRKDRQSSGYFVDLDRFVVSP
jgi:hypothetical protein